jgi:hypothetical protein
LFRCGVFFFSGGIREDVLGNLFSSKDFFGKQVKAGKAERGTLLWWSAALFDGLLSLVRHGLRVFSSGAGREDMR